MIRSLLSLTYHTRAIKPTHYYQQYLSETTKQLEIISKDSHTNVIVPCLPVDPQLVIELFEGNKWEKRNIIFHVDTSGVIGQRRQFLLSYLKSGIYQGLQQPPKLYTQINPQLQENVEQLKLTTQIFLLMDPDVKLTRKVQKDQQYLVEAQEQVSELYQKDPNRTKNRLLTQLNIKRQFTDLIQTALDFQSQVYFSGLNQYTLRKLLSSYLSLQDIQSMLLDCLNYSSSHSSDIFNFQHYSRQFIYLTCYDFLQPFEMMRLRMLRKYMPKSIIFSHSYTYKSLLHSPLLKVQMPASKGTDDQRIQKNAILEVLLGNLWDKKITKNKFPYLSQSFYSLSAEDQSTVSNLYIKNLARYTSAKNAFYRNLNKPK